MSIPLASPQQWGLVLLAPRMGAILELEVLRGAGRIFRRGAIGPSLMQRVWPREVGTQEQGDLIE